MKKITPFFQEMMKRGMKHFVPELSERDDFEVGVSKCKCAICNEVTDFPRYRFYGQKEWIPAFSEQKVNCKACTDKKELAKVFDANKINARETLKQRFEKEYWEIPNDLIHAGFKNFMVDGKSIVFEAKRTAMEYVKAFTEAEPEKRYNLLIMGNPGTGKTHLVTAVARTLKEKGFLVGFLTTGKLLSKIQSTFNNGASYTKEDVFRDLSRFDLLVLDI